MTDFRTSISCAPTAMPIRHEDSLLSMGSCFAENIGQRLTDAKFQLNLNPFGIIYNPISVLECLSYVIENKAFKVDDVFYYKERWHSFSHHSRFSHTDQFICVNQINAAIQKAHWQLEKLDVLILTFGTAHVFYHKKLEKVVSNCHQLPADIFERQLLTVDEITKPFVAVLERIKTLRPDVRVILTVSPVRHIRDGLVESKLSKSTLLVAVHELCRRFAHVSYFPSYEIIMDDLRDYRFYHADMIHPNEVALKYIFERFGEVYFDKATEELIKRIEKLQQAMQHRPFNADSQQHRNFLQQYFNQTSELKKAHPYLDFEQELSYFSGI